MRVQLPWIGIERLVNNWRGSIMCRAWHWWLGQLRSCLPERWTRPPAEQIYSWPLTDSRLPLPESRQAVLLLQPDQALMHSLTLPLAARNSLDTVLAFELDRFTPFRPEQVHHVVHAKSVRAGRLHVTLTVVRREQMAQWLSAFSARGITLARIDLLNEEGQRLGTQLIPADASHAPQQRTRRWLYGMVAMLVMMVAAMEWMLHDREQALAALTLHVNHQREEVAGLQELRRELQQAGDAESYLDNLKQEQPPRSLLLAELSACLPSTTWLQSLQINKQGQVDLAGFSADPGSLITQVKQCPHLSDPQYQGIILPDADSGKDRFYLRAQVSKGVEHASLTVGP
jgi:general secretion pathway protein L